MNKKSKTTDNDNPEWTEKMFREAKRFYELPLEMQHDLLSLKKRGRPKVEKPKKLQSFKLSQDVIESIKATGRGYNARVEAVLRKAFAPIENR